jgi:predicted SprT family Zn-dependent metalloprotease
VNVSEVKAFARAQLDEYGYTDWSVEIDRAKRRAGQTRYSDKTITISRYHIESNSDEEVMDTVLHEVAHVLAPSGSHHGPEWQATARAVGARPERVARTGMNAPHKWEGTCPAGHVIKRHRLTDGARRSSCPFCSDRFDPQYKFTWTKVEPIEVVQIFES